MSPFTRRNTVRALLAFALAALTVAAAGCSSQNLADTPEPSQAPGTTVSMTIATDKTGTKWDPTTVGLSLEATELNNEALADGNLSNYLKTLGKTGHVRFGADAADATYFSSSNEAKPDWARSVITPADLERAAALMKKSGWKASITVNFRHFDPERAADEAKHAQQAFGKSLDSVQIGNEPEVYYPDFATYLKDYETYVAAIKAAAPDVKITGGDFKGGKRFLNDFVTSSANSDVSMLTQHYYPQSACAGLKTPTIEEMLGSSLRNAQGDVIKAQVKTAAPSGHELQITETNSVSCEGAKGVSDTYASALWATDFALQAQQAGATGVQLHGSITECGAPSPLYKFYTPLCAASAADAAAAKLTAAPEYSGLVAVRWVPAGTFVEVTNPKSDRIRAFAVTRKGSTSLVLINIDKAGTAPIAVDLSGLSVESGKATVLKTNSPDGLSAKDGIEFGGKSVTNNGKLASPRAYKVEPADGKTRFVSEPGTVAILELK